MRSFVLILSLCIFLTSTVFGGEYPVDKGSVLISGRVGISSYSGNVYEDEAGNTLSAFTLTPTVLAFLMPKLALGGNASVFYESQGNVQRTLLFIGPDIAYFIGGPDSKNYPHLIVGFNYLSETVEVAKLEASVSGTRFFVGVGIHTMVTSHLAIVTEGAYFFENVKPEGGKSKSGRILTLQMGLAGFIF